MTITTAFDSRTSRSSCARRDDTADLLDRNWHGGQDVPAWGGSGHAVPRRVRGAAERERRGPTPDSRRPSGAGIRYRGTGVLVSRASHRPRPITPATTVLLAVVAGAITLWLGLIAQAGGLLGGAAEMPGRLAVVQVQTGESLHHVAQRVAPDAPVSEVVERIRDLNRLDSAALNAGQTLIAPVS